MRSKNFLRSFLFLFATLSIVLLVTDYFYESNNDQNNFDRDARLLWQSLSSHLDQSNLEDEKIQTISIRQLSWSKTLLEQLRKNGFVILPQKDGSRVFHGLIADTDRVIIYLLPKEPDPPSQWLWWLVFYSAIAAAIAGWLFPWISDIQRLQQAATKFSTNQHYQAVQTSTNSPLKIVSDALNNMTIRISRLISLQRDVATFALHDIRTPLSRIRFACELIEDKNHRELKQDIREDISEVEDLLSELLNYAEFEYTNPNLTIQPHQLSVFLHQIIEKFRSISAVNINEAYCAELVVNIDRRLFARAVTNLISNCLRYAKDTIWISTKFERNTIKIVIEDNGPGIDQNSINDLTLPFVRFANREDNNTDEHNSGLGLAIVETICRWHGFGFVVDNSEEHEGARFVCVISQ